MGGVKAVVADEGASVEVAKDFQVGASEGLDGLNCLRADCSASPGHHLVGHRLHLEELPKTRPQLGEHPRHDTIARLMSSSRGMC